MVVSVSLVRFKTALKLHYSQTTVSVSLWMLSFKTTLKLHYSQTDGQQNSTRGRFKTTLKLHYSQTSNPRLHKDISGYEPQRECNFFSILKFAEVIVNSQSFFMG